MITEKHFALSHAAFWHQLIPMAEAYVRECNADAARFQPKLEHQVAPDRRGIVNELGFRLYAASITLGRAASVLPANVIEESITAAVEHVSQMRHFDRGVLAIPEQEDVDEASILADRLALFFKKVSSSTPVLFPPFVGCGWLDQCRGDALLGSVLFEVKAGARGFRGSDIRQLLCYCALNFASKVYPIADICLVNPRSGRYVTDSLDNLCARTSGRSSVEILAEIVEYVSEPVERYGIG